MRSIKIFYADGSTNCTNINGTDEEIRRYYVGQFFNLGAMGTSEDRLVRCTGVEFLS